MAGARTAGDFLADAPARVVPLLSRNDRLDMLDYYRYGSTRGIANEAGDTARITAESAAVVSFDMGTRASMQIAVLPAGRDTVLAVVTTVSLPARDSSVQLFDTAWQPLARVKSPVPAYSQWFVDGAFDADPNLEMKLPFMPAEARFDSTATVLTFTPSAGSYMSPSEYEGVRSLLVPEIIFDVKKGKFRQRR